MRQFQDEEEYVVTLHRTFQEYLSARFIIAVTVDTDTDALCLLMERGIKWTETSKNGKTKKRTLPGFSWTKQNGSFLCDMWWDKVIEFVSQSISLKKLARLLYGNSSSEFINKKWLDDQCVNRNDLGQVRLHHLFRAYSLCLPSSSSVKRDKLNVTKTFQKLFEKSITAAYRHLASQPYAHHFLCNIASFNPPFIKQLFTLLDASYENENHMKIYIWILKTINQPLPPEYLKPKIETALLSPAAPFEQQTFARKALVGLGSLVYLPEWIEGVKCWDMLSIFKEARLGEDFLTQPSHWLNPKWAEDGIGFKVLHWICTRVVKKGSPAIRELVHQHFMTLLRSVPPPPPPVKLEYGMIPKPTLTPSVCFVFLFLFPNSSLYDLFIWLSKQLNLNGELGSILRELFNQPEYRHLFKERANCIGLYQISERSIDIGIFQVCAEFEYSLSKADTFGDPCSSRSTSRTEHRCLFGWRLWDVLVSLLQLQTQ